MVAPARKLTRFVKLGGGASVVRLEDGTRVDHGQWGAGGTDRVFVSGHVTLHAEGRALVWASGEALIMAKDDVRVWATDEVMVKASGRAQVVIIDAARTIAFGHVRVMAAGAGGLVQLSGHARCVAIGGRSVSANDRVEVDAHDDSQAWVSGETRIHARDRARITWFTGSETIRLDDGATSRRI